MISQTLSAAPVTPAAKSISTLADDATAVVTGTLDRVVMGNTLWAWITFGSVLIGSFFLVWLLRAAVLARLKRWAERTTTRVDDLVVSLVSDVRLLLVAPALIMFAARGLAVSEQVDRSLHVAALIGIAVQLIMSSRLLIDFGLKTLAHKHRGEDGQPDPTLVSSLGVLRVIAMLVIVTVVVLLALDNLGIEIKPLLAGLGIGGIAVALAVQNLLSDLFGSLTILLDKPFVVGDFITVGDKAGTIERIGIKTTRVRALSGEQLVFANSDLLTSRLHNYKRMTERRVVFTIGVIYETPPALLERIPTLIREAVLANSNVRVDRCHLSKLNSYSIDFETVYFVTSPDYNRYMDTQQAINLSLIRKFAELGVSFAYPTQVEFQKVQPDDRDALIPLRAVLEPAAAGSKPADPGAPPASESKP